MFHNLSYDYAIKLWLMWQHDQSTLTLVVLKIENWKINWKENKRWKEKYNKPSSTSSILIQGIRREMKSRKYETVQRDIKTRRLCKVYN